MMKILKSLNFLKVLKFHVHLEFLYEIFEIFLYFGKFLNSFLQFD
jgi:hypothetical protein